MTPEATVNFIEGTVERTNETTVKFTFDEPKFVIKITTTAEDVFDVTVIFVNTNGVSETTTIPTSEDVQTETDVTQHSVISVTFVVKKAPKLDQLTRILLNACEDVPETTTTTTAETTTMTTTGTVELLVETTEIFSRGSIVRKTIGRPTSEGGL